MVIAFSSVKYAVNSHPGDVVKDASPFPFVFLKFEAFIPHKRAYLQARLSFSKIGQGFKKAFCNWILFTMGNVDRDIGRHSGRYSGR